MPKAMPADEVMPSKFQRFTSLFVQVDKYRPYHSGLGKD
jgi:hypothetical protein